MKDEEMIVAIAEAEGWTHCKESGDKLTSKDAYWYPPNAVTEAPFKEPQEMRHLNQLPRYLSDLNAMHEAEKVLGDKWRNYMPILHEVCGRTVQFCIHATARQRAIAFCRTLFPERFKV